MDSVFTDLFEKVFEIVIRRSMAEENARFQLECGGKASKPCPMPGVELRVRGAVRRAHLFRGPVEQLAIVISPDVHVAFAHKRIRRGSGLQRTGEVISQVDDQIRRLLPEIGLNGFERSQITVDVGENGDPQAHS